MITTRGFQQIEHLKNKWKDKNDIELVITDKDYKSLITAKGIFQKKPLISIEFLYSPNYEYSDKIFNANRNDYGKKYHERIKLFYDFIRERKEVSIAYVGHDKFISHLANKQNIKRCYPYLFELSMKDYCEN
jgi:hypothetical protein